MIDNVARSNRLRPELLHAIVRAESSYDPRARSRTGAMGLMQLMPATAKRYGVSDRWNPKANLNGGARYLKDLLSMFQNDLKLALAAYNAGENAVKKYGNKVPPFPETQQYVTRVLAFYQKNRKSANIPASR
ncbi:lytic transglycosylase domain-containing protein [Candidatus Vondammii sp. HM_W22]|uniref:lytic transglycosylase domain-containing protein n=1 Tax=Candidatus Vondammii sp. HM_W22 TaxID=2687299 RepID=UPI002E7B535C|nr:lytic transglycosylase domain-containing protein [Candidatus Vondammii sp. HM_W22]